MTTERDGVVDPEDTAPEESLDSLRAQLEEERNRAQGYYQSYLRTLADFQNHKRRADEERQRNALFASLALVMNILPIQDDLDRALQNIDAAVAESSWVEGIRQIARKFQGALDASGVKEIPAENQPFDPNLHEAVTEAPGEQGTVVQVLRKGYTMGDRVIRPAMVMVGNGQDSGAGANSQ